MFFGMFFTSMNQFLASNSSSISWHVYSAKKIGQKRSFLHEIRAQTFYYTLYGVATAYSTNENPSTDKLNRAINYRSWYPTHWGTPLKTSKTRALPLNSLVGKRLMTLSKTSPINLAPVDNKDVDLKPVSEEEYSSNWLWVFLQNPSSIISLKKSQKFNWHLHAFAQAQSNTNEHLSQGGCFFFFCCC